MRHAIVDASLIGRFATLPGSYTRIAVGGAPGWHRFEDAYDAAETFVPDGETRATDPLVMYFTSGTTAKPKLVLHSHQSYPVGLLSAMYCFARQPGDIQLGIASPGWAAHMYGLFAGWNAGTAILAMAQPRFDARKVLDVLARCGVTVFWGPPTVWRMLIQEELGPKPAGLRGALSGGEPLNPEVIEHVQRAWGLTLRDVYGQTETTLLVGNSSGQAIVPGSMGRPMPGFLINLLDENGTEVEEGQGEIAVALDPPPLGLLQGYQQDDGSVRPIEGRYYRIGDLALRGDDGRLIFIGRADDVFKSFGYRVSPFEIESALIEHEAVAEAAVVPSPDPQRLAVPKAFILLAAGYRPFLQAFNRSFAETYFRVVAEAIRRHDPHHLYLGSRFQTRTPEAVAACAKYCDVVSFNIYREELRGAEWTRFHDLRKPALIGEFQFGSTDTGLFWPGLFDVAAEEQRGPAYAAYLRSAAANPDIVGCHWFQYVDEPLTGRVLDGENGNMGFVTVTDTP